MSTKGPNLPGSATDSGGRFNAWSNPTNALLNDGVFATCLMNPGENSNPLQLRGFAMAIPGGATILGIQADVKLQATGGTCVDNGVFLTKTAGEVGSDKSRAATNWSATPALITFGGAADLWGTTWAAADFNADFGLDISAIQNSGTVTAQIDYVQITVTYSGGVAKSMMMMGIGA